jgi:hypothetical protein
MASKYEDLAGRQSHTPTVLREVTTLGIGHPDRGHPLVRDDHPVIGHTHGCPCPGRNGFEQGRVGPYITPLYGQRGDGRRNRK